MRCGDRVSLFIQERTLLALLQQTLGKPRVIRRFLVWTLAALLIFVVLGAILIFHTPVLPAVERNPAAAAQLQARIKEAEATASPASPKVLQVDQNEFNSLIASYFDPATEGQAQNSSNSVRDMRITLADDLVHMYVILNIHGKDLSLELAGRLRTVNGIAEFDPVSGNVGALPIPRSTLQSSMRKMMNSPDSRAALRLPDNLSDIHIENGRIMATFR